MPKMRNVPSSVEFPDLFGDIAVSLDDVELWLDFVPRIPRTSPRRREYYANNWDVVNKIKRAKLDGTFDALTSDPDAAYLDGSRLGVVLRAFA